MIPGLGFLYSGLARRKSALTMIWVCMASFSVITFQWYFWGYSLAFSAQGTSGFIGDLTHFGLRNTLGAPSPGSPLIPELLYSFYQVRLLCPIPCSSKPFQMLNALISRCNSAQPQPPLSAVLSPNAAVSFRLWSSCFYGPRSSTAPSPAGPGTSTAGPSNTGCWTMRAAALSKLAPACPLWHTVSSSGGGRRR